MKKEIYSTSVCLVILFSSFIYIVQTEKVGVYADTNIPPGSITLNTIWTLSGSPYYIEGDVYVEEGVNLTIEPGVDVRFNGYYSLFINGTLNAVGNPNKFINFTSNISTPSPGDWRQIRTNPSGIVKMEFCNLSYGHDPLYLEYSNRSIVKNNIIFNSNHCALIIHYSNDVNVSNNLFKSNEMIGISVYGSSNNTFYNNSFYDTARYSFLINGNQQAHFDNFVDISNRINNKPVYYFHSLNNSAISYLNAGMIEVAWSNNVTISNCTVNEADAITFIFINNSMISDCNTSGNYRGIWLIRSHNNIVDSNSAYYNRDDGIALYQFCTNNTVSNNIVKENEGSGIFNYMKSDWNKIINNIIINNYIGIYMFSTPGKYNYISGNLISNNSNGISFIYGDHNIICYNRFISNGIGIEAGDAKYNKIYNNNISDSKSTAISISASFDPNGYNEVFLNDIYSNQNGLYFGSSKKNRVFNNNFINNIQFQAKELDSGNFFNETYPTSGNYWSDYNGIDLNSTPSQNVPPPDGIGDTPYDIDSDSKDYYPLINPHPSAGIPSIYLNEGWNLISIPLIQEDQRLVKVLENISEDYDIVQWYNGSKKEDPWKHNKRAKPFGNDLIKLNESMGFWIYINKPGGTHFNYTGSPLLTSLKIPLNIGWNLVGYPSLTSKNRTNALNNINFSAEVNAIWSYDTATQKWGEMGESDYFEIGKGYYIHAKSKCEWEVPL